MTTPSPAVIEFRKLFLNENSFDSSSQFREEVSGQLPKLLEAFIERVEREAYEREGDRIENAVSKEFIKHTYACPIDSKDPLVLNLCKCGADEHNYAIRQALNAIRKITNSQSQEG